MTEKKSQIIKSALELFSSNGFNATSTSKIAKHAGVSEGLIFRHFENKDGLLKALSTIGEEQLTKMFTDVVMEPNPKKLLNKAINMPFNVKVEDYEFWKLQFKLKWELDDFEDDFSKPFQNALSFAFKELGYQNPELEAQSLFYILEGVGIGQVKGLLKKGEALRKFLLAKYDVEKV